MPVEIEFPDVEPRFVFERDCLSFPARVDGSPVECQISGELLNLRFGASDLSEKSLREAFDRHKDTIQSIARHHIRSGWIDKDGRVILLTRFTTFKVNYHDRVMSWREGRAGAQQATDVLQQLIGPAAGEIFVDWDVANDEAGSQLLLVRISDGTDSVSGVFHPATFESPGRARGKLARLWGGLVRARLHQLLLRSG